PICVSDACATHSQERHDNALAAFAGYCRTMTTQEFVLYAASYISTRLRREAAARPVNKRRSGDLTQSR
ncbi:MAG TPA: hypothetical protein VIN77_10955, partial [Aurantimonas sp.]